MKFIIIFLLLFTFTIEAKAATDSEYIIFDDKTLLEGYAAKYADESKETILARINDETLSPYQTAAAVRAFREKFSDTLLSREKKIVRKALIRRLSRTDSIFIEIEIMYTLCVIDRYKYFKSMVPNLIRRLDHYNKAANELAYVYLNNIIESGQNRTREARIIFNTLRKNLFLSRNRLQNITEPNSRLKQKIELLRWSIKILGTEKLKKLPPESLHLF